jgi:hypothetical protein
MQHCSVVVECDATKIEGSTLNSFSFQGIAEDNTLDFDEHLIKCR